ncbi:MAG: CoA transferase, partial [Planctomycetes bacterium]|nr:CoA transferase [Planctomycetota bacterium]
MHAVTFRSPFEVACVEVTDPVLEAPTDAIVRVELAAICGSDLHVYRGVEAGLDPGTVLGHEFLGTITAVGAAVQRHRRGDRVVSPFSSCCGACWFCQRGLTSRCQDSQLFGWVQDGRGLQGGQAELVRVPHADASLVAVPADVGLEPALLAGDVLATGFHAAAQGEVGAGDVVVVIGLGPIGLCALLGSKERGAGAVFGVDSVPERLELAARFGGVPLGDLASAGGASVRAALVGGRADVVIENYRLGTMDKLGLGWPQLEPRNPGLVYCSLSGFGRTGPYADRGGFDLVAQGMSGLMSITGEGPGRPPVKCGAPVSDITAGILAAMGILGALWHRQATGRGQCVDTSLFEAGIVHTYWQSAIAFATGVAPGAMGSAHPLNAPYQAFPTADGWINV